MRGSNFIEYKKPTKIRNNLCGFLGVGDLIYTPGVEILIYIPGEGNLIYTPGVGNPYLYSRYKKFIYIFMV